MFNTLKFYVMKKNLIILAAAAACFGLIAMTGCEETSTENQDNTEQTDGEGSDTEGEGTEQQTYSIEKQWVTESTEGGVTVKQCIDINYGVEGLLVGVYNEGYASMLPEGADPDKSYIAMAYSADKIVSITETNKTSGTIVYATDITGDGTLTEFTMTYSNLTENSVDIVYTDVYNQTFNLSCTVAPEGTKIYTMADLM